MQSVDNENVILIDPLLNSTIGERNGGRFLDNRGWTLTAPNERIIWRLPEIDPNDRFEIDISNLNPPGQVTGGKNMIIAAAGCRPWGNTV